jgi:hypothetical protein
LPGIRIIENGSMMSGPENIEGITKNIMRTAFNLLIRLPDRDRTFGNRIQ